MTLKKKDPKKRVDMSRAVHNGKATQQDLELLERRAMQYDSLGDSEKNFASAKKETRDHLVEGLREFGAPREGGGFVVETESYLMEIVHQNSKGLNEQAIEAFLEKNPSLEKRVTTRVYDPKKLEELNLLGEIPDKEYAKMITQKTVERINVKSKL